MTNKLIKLNDTEFKLIRDLIYEKSGINLNSGKKGLLQSRLLKRINELKLDNYMKYRNLVVKDKTGIELEKMLNLISTNKTDFFRENNHFKLLKRLLKEKTGRDELFIWCAGCSTGEEAYSLAMCVEENININKLKNYKILATDIDTNVLDKAESGIYDYTRLQPFSEEKIKRNFRKKDKKYIIKDRLKENIRFRYYNLMDKPPFSKKFDFIFCRNVMIYFDIETQKKVVERLTNHLKPGGYFFIGHSETLSCFKTGLKFIQPSVYKN